MFPKAWSQQILFFFLSFRMFCLLVQKHSGYGFSLFPVLMTNIANQIRSDRCLSKGQNRQIPGQRLFVTLCEEKKKILCELLYVNKTQQRDESFPVSHIELSHVEFSCWNLPVKLLFICYWDSQLWIRLCGFKKKKLRSGKVSKLKLFMF